MKKINLSITNEVYDDLKQHMMCNSLANPNSGSLPNQILNKIVKVIDEGRTEFTLEYKDDNATTNDVAKKITDKFTQKMEEVFGPEAYDDYSFYDEEDDSGQ